ncbi:MAG: radical SAM protein [Peptococcaceae bacterium]|nr:MAG: radical SAM protein [Peptococcaceae bacterium]
MSSPEFLNITREKFKRALARESKPVYAWFSLNDACNLDCKYCFADARYVPSESQKAIKDSLSTQDVLNIIDNVAEAGTKSIMFAGGEPTLRKDLPQIIRHTSQYMDVAMNTNGYFLDRELLRELAYAGLTQVKVSIDGLQESHDWNRGEGSFERAVNALKLCKELGIPTVILIMTLSRLNHKELPEMIELAMKLGVDFTMVEFLPLGKASGKKEWTMEREQRREMQRYLFKAQEKYGWQKIAFENRYIITEDEFCKKVCADPSRPCGFFDFSVGCISGIYSYCISAEGKAVAGDIMEIEVGDLKKESLSDIWKNSEVFNLLRDRDKLKGKCGKCNYRYVCGGCRRRAYTFTGDMMAADPGCWVDAKTGLEK